MLKQALTYFQENKSFKWNYYRTDWVKDIIFLRHSILKPLSFTLQQLTTTYHGSGIINTKQSFQRLFVRLRPLVRFRPRLLRDQPGRGDGRDFLLQGHDAVHRLCLPNKRQTGGGALQVSLLALFRIVLHLQKYLF